MNTPVINEIYPIFLKVSQLNTLLVGPGSASLEKLTFLLKSSPHAKVTVVAPEISVIFTWEES